MDIVALDKASLIDLYQDRYNWLLDYDLNEMNAKFGSSASNDKIGI